MLGTDHILHKGRYRVISSFRQDDSGGLYDAYDTVSNTNVVLRESLDMGGKIANSNQIEAMNEAFVFGAKVLFETRHESLVSVKDYFSEIDRQYLVLEAVTGSNLTKYLEPGQPKPALADVLSWADQLLNALHYLHSLSPPVIHSDIRPENIKLTSDQKVKLLTAKVPMSSAYGDVSLGPGQIIENTAFNYKPLEQFLTGLDPTSQRVILNSYDEKAAGILLRPLDARSDIYSMGASLYHVMTGVMPNDALERSIGILDGKPDPLRKPADLDSSIPLEISDTLMRAMSIRRENRFDSAIIFCQILRTAVVRARERELGISDHPVAVLRVVERPDALTTESELKLEQTRVEERQHEIAAEQAHLNEERKRIELLRLEIEAEKERQIAEQTRVHLEREKAVERQREIDRISEETPNDDLVELELEPVPSARPLAVADAHTHGETGIDLIVSDLSSQGARRWHIPVVCAVALLLVAAFAIWKFLPAANAIPTASIQQQPAVTTEQEVNQPITSEPPVSIQEQPVIQEPSAASVTLPSPPDPLNEKPKRPQISTVQERQKKPAQEKVPPTKKKLTVDDLIRDN